MKSYKNYKELVESLSKTKNAMHAMVTKKGYTQVRLWVIRDVANVSWVKKNGDGGAMSAVDFFEGSKGAIKAEIITSQYEKP